jgi:hypothetical protein
MNVQKNCIKCKGRLWCRGSFCPILRKTQVLARTVKGFNPDSSSISGEAPSVFVGRIGYPEINVGILSANDENTAIYDDPRRWANENFEIPKIIDYRASLINSRFKANVHNKPKYLETSQEVALSSKPVEMDIELKDKPKFRVSFHSNTPPMGPNAQLEKAEMKENPKIHTKVEKVFNETDRKASDSMNYLFEHGFDENFLSRILSIGTLGTKPQRKLVPTRWAITATDDMLGKELTKEIKDFKSADYEFYFGSYLGNYYIFMFFPDVWSYELFETYMPKTAWNTENRIQFMTDHETYDGRKSYAENCVGGYYSVRLALLEKLKSMKRQATVLTLRFITDDYAVPLGVWVTREAARKALNSRPIIFSDKDTMLNYAKALVKKKWGYDAECLYKESILLKNMKSQIKLTSFT